MGLHQATPAAYFSLCQGHMNVFIICLLLGLGRGWGNRRSQNLGMVNLNEPPKVTTFPQKVITFPQKITIHPQLVNNFTLTNFDPKICWFTRFIVKCRKSNLRTFCPQFHQCANIGGRCQANFGNVKICYPNPSLFGTTLQGTLPSACK